MSGKGSRQRPTDKAKFDEGYERIFGKRDRHKKSSDCLETCPDCHGNGVVMNATMPCLRCKCTGKVLPDEER